MTDIERDRLFFNSKRGRYAEGGPYEHATHPMEAAAGTNVQANARAALADSFASRPIHSDWVDSRAQLPQVEPIEPVEPVGYTQVTMTRDPFINGYKDGADDDTRPMEAAAVADLPDFAPATMYREN